MENAWSLEQVLQTAASPGCSPWACWALCAILCLNRGGLSVRPHGLYPAPAAGAGADRRCVVRGIRRAAVLVIYWAFPDRVGRCCCADCTCTGPTRPRWTPDHFWPLPAGVSPQPAPPGGGQPVGATWPCLPGWGRPAPAVPPSCGTGGKGVAAAVLAVIGAPSAGRRGALSGRLTMCAAGLSAWAIGICGGAAE